MQSDIRSEEDVKFKMLVPFLKEHGYKQDCIDFNVSIEVQEGRKKKTIFADAVVYASKSRKAPLVLCETKAPTEVLGRAAREQAISYARLLPRIAPIALISNGAQVQVFQTLTKNRVAELPRRKDLDASIVDFVVSKALQEALRQEAKHELFIIDDVTTFKSLLKACHNEIRNNDGLDPTAAFDEMSKVMFCKLYEEKENGKHNRFRLGVFDDSLERLGVNVVRKILEDAKQAPRYGELFTKETEILLRDRTIRRIVELFENYDLSLTAFDVKGEAFEYFLGDTFTGGLGEYFTPRNIVEFIVHAIDPKIGERIIDPFCGTGGFLIYAFEVVSDKIRSQDFADAEKARWKLELSSRSLFGTDWKERTSQACRMNMMVHGDGSSGVFRHDGLVDVAGHISEGSFDVCITNPPFGSWESDIAVLTQYETASGRKKQDRVILAVERALRLVRVGGRVGIVVIDGVLNNQSTKYVRDFIRRNARVLGVISLSKETFEGYGASAKTSVLLLERIEPGASGPENETFFAIASNTGYAANGEQVPGNVLPEVLLAYQGWRSNGKLRSPEGVNCVVASPVDRLDPEFYVTRTAKASSDLPALRRGLRSALERSILLSEKIDREIERCFAEASFEERSLGSFLEEVDQPERIEPDRMYRQLGVRWWGEGVYLREQKLGREIKAARLYRVPAGSLIYNRLFAFKGSFAVVSEEFDGCHVSNEFPIMRVKDGAEPALMARYFVHLLTSPGLLRVIDAQSTGSTKTSRNRFHQSLLLKLNVKVPATSEQMRRLVDLLDAAVALRSEQASLLDDAKSLREQLLSLLPH